MSSRHIRCAVEKTGHTRCAYYIVSRRRLRLIHGNDDSCLWRVAKDAVDRAQRLGSSGRNRLKIAIIGTGNVGESLGTHWAKAGHQVVFGSRDPSAAKVQEVICRANPTVCAELPHVSIQNADVIVLAVPWQQAEATLRGLGDLTGRIVVDCTNPLKPDLSGLETAGGPSAAEQIAGWAKGARVVKAFNTASTKVMKDPHFNAHRATMFYCGDDAAAKEVVHQLCEAVGFEPVDAGPLSVAHYLESLAMFYIHLAFKQGWGSNCAFKMLKR